MALIDDYLERAGAGAVVMAAEDALSDLRHNTPAELWSVDGNRTTYRGAFVELHDEWMWGWMVRRADGRYVETA